MSSSDEVTLDADAVRTPSIMPAYCSRHGQPAVRRVDFVLQSRVRPSGPRANLFSAADRLGQWARNVRVTHVRGWPLCRICSRTRMSWLLVAGVLFWGGLAVFLGAMTLGVFADPPSEPLALAAVLGLFGMLGAAFPFSRAGLARVVRARTSDDGSSVILEQPHPAFLAGPRAAE